MKRSEPVLAARPAISSRLVEPTSETTVSGPLADSASAARPGSAATGAAQKTTSASATASATEPARPVERPELEALVDVGGDGVEAGHLGVGPPLRGEPDRAADQPDA